MREFRDSWRAWRRRWPVLSALVETALCFFLCAMVMSCLRLGIASPLWMVILWGGISALRPARFQFASAVCVSVLTDLLTGQPIGQSLFVYSAAMFAANALVPGVEASRWSDPHAAFVLVAVAAGVACQGLLGFVLPGLSGPSPSLAQALLTLLLACGAVALAYVVAFVRAVFGWDSRRDYSMTRFER